MRKFADRFWIQLFGTVLVLGIAALVIVAATSGTIRRIALAIYG